jgi:hypothetical protein
MNLKPIQLIDLHIPPKILEIIETHIAPKDFEKEKFGEVFTPISLNYFFKSSYSSIEFAGEVYLET